MYNKVLLTDAELLVLYKVLDHHFNRSFIDTSADDMEKLRIIKNNLEGIITTDRTSEKV